MMRLYTGISLIIFFFLVFFAFPAWCMSVFLLFCLLEILVAEWPLLAKNNTMLWLFTPFYPIMPFLFLLFLNHSEIYRFLFMVLIMCAASFDTGSYLFGTLWGKHQLAPRISPGKTWQGVFGGFLTVLTILWLGSIFFQVKISVPLVIGFSVLVSIIALMGDLFESWLKRKAQVKDSGTLLPGHGGLLDRFDAILFLAVFFFLTKNYLIFF